MLFQPLANRTFEMSETLKANLTLSGFGTPVISGVGDLIQVNTFYLLLLLIFFSSRFFLFIFSVFHIGFFHFLFFFCLFFILFHLFSFISLLLCSHLFSIKKFFFVFLYLFFRLILQNQIGRLELLKEFDLNQNQKLLGQMIKQMI